MTLLEEAIRAEHISDAFTKYQEPNPDYVQNINAAISELAGLGGALRQVDALLEKYGERLYTIEDDLKFVHESITFTLADLWLIIGTIGDRPDTPLTPEDFKRNWRRIIRYCRHGSGQDLATRMDIYRRFLGGLCNTLKRRPFDHDEFEILQRVVREIAPPTALHMSEGTEQVPEPLRQVPTEQSNGGLSTKRSYERQRETAPMSPTESGASSPPPFAIRPDSVPSPPTSPTNTFSTISQISSIDQETEHWALRVFKEMPSRTLLPTTREKSEYHEIPGDVVFEPPGDSFDEVVVMGFPPDPPGLRVVLLYRRRDLRAKLVAYWKDRKGRNRKACLPLNMLVVYRRGPMLHLCRRAPDGKTNVAWLSLKFTTLERLTLLACTFLSMRAHDGKKPVKPLDDWEFEGESLQFAGKIRDRGYSHALRIYRDKASKGIRLQASVRGGSLDCTPVWTAFVTDHVKSKTWCQLLDRNVVCLRELRPQSFSSTYECPRLPNGAFVLNFESQGDARQFVDCIDDLGREARKAKKQ